MAEADPEADSAAGTSSISTERQALRIHLLGEFQVHVGQRRIRDEEWRLRKARSLLKLLALTPDHQLHRERVAYLLWPELNLAAALNNLHRAIFVLRDLLEPGRVRAAPSRWIALRAQSLTLCPAEDLWVDIKAFEQTRAAAHQTRGVHAYQAALALYTGDLLLDDPLLDDLPPDDSYRAWAIGKREELRAHYVALLADIAKRHLAQHTYGDALSVLQRLVAAQPAHEEAGVMLMRLHALHGERYEALRQYQLLRNALRELDAAPATTTQQLIADIQAGRSPLQGLEVSATPLPRPVPPDAGGPNTLDIPEQRTAAAAPGMLLPLSAASRRRTNVTDQWTSFVGRGQESARIRQLLATERLVTLTGVGGCGKTRLALALASELAPASHDAYRDGVWLVELAALRDPCLVPQAVAEVLGVREEVGRPLSETLAEALKQQQMLLLMDNCEHLLVAAAHLVDTLLRACPGLHILATSRRKFQVSDEAPWCVPSLATPNPDQLPPFDTLLACDAIRLFVERAATCHPGFALTMQNAAAVVRVCHRLEGIPLALELAAGRMRLLTAEQLAARLDNCFSALGSNPAPGVPHRQRTLRATIDWSHDLLTEPERILFRRLAIFAGGWTLEAAEEVCSGESIESRDVLDLLARLVEHSLVAVEERGASMRYRLLETIRQYAAEQLLTAGEDGVMRWRYGRWALALVEEAEPHLIDMEQKVWLARLAAEHDNLRAALGWALERGEAEIGLRLAGAVMWFWYSRGLLAEGQRWLEALLAAADQDRSSVSPAARAKALYAIGWLERMLGDIERATRHSEESMALSTELQDPLGITRALNTLGGLAGDQGENERSKELMTRCLVLARQHGLKRRIVIALSNLADLAWDDDDVERAGELYGECLALAREWGDVRSVAMALTNLGRIAFHWGDAGLATKHLEKSLSLFRDLGDMRGIAEALTTLGDAACVLGDTDQALARYRESLTLYQMVGYKLLLPPCLEGVAHAAHHQGRSECAARLLGVAEALRETMNAPIRSSERARYQDTVEGLRATLGASTFAMAQAIGRTLSLEQALAEAFVSIGATSPGAGPTRRSTTSRKTSSQNTSLTSRECEVAQFLTAGLTNHEIAVRLRIGPRTVETHVSHILAKLGVTSRFEAAERLAAQLPFQPRAPS